MVVYNQNKDDGLKKSGDYVGHLFFFNGFQPLSDLSLETLFAVLPRLSDVTDEEWIFPESFEAKENNRRSNLLPVRNPGHSQISSCHAVNVRIKTHHVVEDPEEVNDSSFDVQKKIAPSAAFLENPFDSVTGKNERDGSLNCQLIVIATLVDKIPNLGGLCR